MFAAHTRDGQIIMGKYRASKNADPRQVLLRHLKAANIEVVYFTNVELTDEPFQTITVMNEEDVFKNTCRRTGMVVCQEDVSQIGYKIETVDKYPSVDGTVKPLSNGQAITIGHGHGDARAFATFVFNLDGRLVTYGIFAEQDE
jgi:hypothetical protein